jgi:hypothetical protein
MISDLKVIIIKVRKEKKKSIINNGSQNVFLSFSMGLRRRGMKFTNIHQPMLKLKTSRLFKRHKRKKIPRCSDKNNAKILDGRKTIV